MAANRNSYLDAGFSEDSGNGDGYDSEAAELSKGGGGGSSGRAPKRRRLSRDHDDSGSEDGEDNDETVPDHDVEEAEASRDSLKHQSNRKAEVPRNDPVEPKQPRQKPPDDNKIKKRKAKKERTPGVIYLSSLPPYLKPSALRNLLAQRGFSPISRLFLTPTSKAKSGSKKNSRQLYAEGWIEFESKKTARHCAEALNANPVGGKKSGFYHDDIWNMKYLRGMGWDELMAGIREEKREEEGRRDEERRVAARETKEFLEGIEESKKTEGMKRKRAEKGGGKETGKPGDENDVIKRTWRQVESKGPNRKDGEDLSKSTVDDTLKRIAGRIF